MTHTPPRFLIPIPGLRVTRPWRVGRVVFHPAGSELVDGLPILGGVDGPAAHRIRQTLKDESGDALAELPLTDEQSADRGYAEDALDEIRSALDALRLFQEARSITHHTSFGLPGDLYQASIEFVLAAERVAPGSMFQGDYTGWTFSDDSHRDWSTSPAFQFLSAALADPNPGEGAHRAVLGTKLYSRAVAEHRPDLKLLGLMTALEAWFLPLSSGGQSYKLARHIAWFNCMRHEGDQCGRQKPMCPYLYIRPEPKRLPRLKRLEDLANEHNIWACSEWLQVRDWYRARSDTAHGNPTGNPTEIASSAQYVIAHYLAEPILNWHHDHPDNPIGDLEQEINDVPVPPGWGAMLRAIDDGHASPPHPT